MTAHHPSSRQLRGARAMLGWSLIETARAARLSVSAVSRVEGDRGGDASEPSFAALRVLFEGEGVAFIRDADGETVRLMR